jgi:hypothetical protein
MYWAFLFNKTSLQQTGWSKVELVQGGQLYWAFLFSKTSLQRTEPSKVERVPCFQKTTEKFKIFLLQSLQQPVH